LLYNRGMGREVRTSWKRVALEEAIRALALEVGIGLPPLGVADMLGADDRTLYLVAAISLSAPVLLAAWILVYRLRTGAPLPRAPRRVRFLLLGLAAVMAVALAAGERVRGLAAPGRFWAVVLINVLWVLVGVSYVLSQG